MKVDADTDEPKLGQHIGKEFWGWIWPNDVPGVFFQRQDLAEISAPSNCEIVKVRVVE